MAKSAAIFGLEGLSLTDWERAFFAEVRPFGFILFGRNLDTPQQIKSLTASLREVVGFDAPILIDQEGGRVQRLTPPHWRQWLPPLDQMAKCAPALAPRAMYLRYRIIAHELTELGIDVNCAPMGDVAQADTHPILHNRCYAQDALSVILAGRAVAQGLLDGGVLPVLKHIPGHGRGTADSHLELPKVSTSLADLQATDFAAFQGLCDLPLGMTAHIVYDAIDPHRPATQSRDVLDLVRRDIGFDGCLMTDDLSMQALTGPMADRARLSLDAGSDLVLHCNGDAAEMEAVMDGCRDLAGKALARAERALAARRAPDTVDISALEAELAALLA